MELSLKGFFFNAKKGVKYKVFLFRLRIVVIKKRSVRMGKLRGLKELGNLIGVSPETVRSWDEASLIPRSARIGRARKRVWGKTNTLAILNYAKEVLGYPIPSRVFEEVNGYETEKK